MTTLALVAAIIGFMLYWGKVEAGDAGSASDWPWRQIR